MSSISKCHGTNCERKLECFRYTKPALNKYQCYILMVVAIPDTTKCKFFMENKSELS